MSKKDKKAKYTAPTEKQPVAETDNTIVTDNTEVAENTTAAEVKPDGQAKNAKAEKPKKAVKKVKKPNIFVRMGKKLKEVFSELKKVTWPTFPTVLKQTGVVLVVVAFFLVVIFLFDSGLSYLYQLLVNS